MDQRSDVSESEASLSSEEEEEEEEEEEVSDWSDEPSPKRPAKNETLDRINGLPEAILVRILSLLPMHQIIKTSSLSKKWQYLWINVPNLVFTNHKSPNRVSDFVRFVDKTLILCRHSKIHKFSISFEYKSQFASHVDIWIRFATRCDVQVLYIDFVCNEQISIYTLPEHIYRCSSVTNLKLRYCNVAPNGLIIWKSLKKLSLHVSNVNEDTLHNIILGSPLLEFLVLDHCKGFKRLDIGSTSLRKLIIDGYRCRSTESKQESILEISGPNLKSLEIIGSFYRRRCRLVNMLSLVDACLNFMKSSNLDGEEDRNMFIEILQSLSHVKELTLGYTCILAMSRLEMKHWPSLSKRKWLRLYTYIVPRFIPVIEDLLQSLVDLETLIIDIPLPSNLMLHGASSVDPFNSEAYWTSRERIFPCLQLHLKTVKIEGLHESDLELVLPFVAFVLKNACVLEKIEMSTQKAGGERSYWASKELPNVARKLLNCPRSSRNAVVVFIE